MECAACNQDILLTTDLIKCTICKLTYHYSCLNISPTYYKNNKAELTKAWTCPSCNNVTRRTRNDNTPIRNCNSSILNKSTLPTDGPVPLDSKTSTSDLTIRNDIILEKITSLLDKKLEENKQSILNEIKNTIQHEILITTEKILLDVNKNIDTIITEQSNINKEIATLNEITKKYNCEKEKLHEEIIQMQNKLDSMNSNILDKKQEQTDNSKKIVLYGLTEYDHETEEELIYRITNIFQDLLQIDLTGYIEEIKRIGKKTYRRPIMIELLSKKMIKHILMNGRCFKNTRLFISEYLGKDELIHRKNLQEQLRKARQNGHHAVIKHNKLIVDGKLNNLTHLTTPLDRAQQHPQHEPCVTHSSSRHSEGPFNSTAEKRNTSNRHTFRT